MVIHAFKPSEMGGLRRFIIPLMALYLAACAPAEQAFVLGQPAYDAPDSRAALKAYKASFEQRLMVKPEIVKTEDGLIGTMATLETLDEFDLKARARKDRMIKRFHKGMTGVKVGSCEWVELDERTRLSTLYTMADLTQRAGYRCAADVKAYSVWRGEKMTYPAKLLFTESDTGLHYVGGAFFYRDAWHRSKTGYPDLRDLLPAVRIYH